jgi:hypothetical protein
MRRIMAVTAPLIVLLAAWALAAKAELFGGTTRSALLVIPFVIAVLALFMSVWYQNSNCFYLILYTLLSYILMNAVILKLPMLNEIVTLPVSFCLLMQFGWVSQKKGEL